MIFLLCCILTRPIKYFVIVETHVELVNRVCTNQKSICEVLVNFLYNFVFASSVVQSSSPFPAVQCDLHVLR